MADNSSPKIVDLINNQGEIFSGPENNVSEMLNKGFRIATPKEIKDYDFKQEQESSLGVGAAVRGAADTATLGLSRLAEDKIAKETGIGLTGEEQKIQAEASPIASTAGEISGFFVGGIPEILAKGGVEATKLAGKELFKIAGKEGMTVANKIVSNKLVRQGLATAVGGAIEGAGQGVNVAIRDSVFEDKPLVAEKVLAEAGVGALIGGVASPVLRQLGKQASKAGSAIKELSDDFLPSLEDIKQGAFSKSIGLTAGQAKKMPEQNLERVINKGLEVAESKLDDAGQIIGSQSKFKSIGELKNIEEYGSKLKSHTEFVGKDLKNKYDQLDAGLSSSLNSSEIKNKLVSTIDDTVAKIKSNEFELGSASKLEQLKKQIIEAPEDSYSSFNNLWNKTKNIGEQINWNPLSEAYKSNEQTTYRKLYSTLKNTIDEEANRINPQLFETFAKSRQDYADLMKLNSFVKNEVSKEKVKPVISGVDAILLGSSALNPQFLAVAGLKKIVQDYSNQALAILANKSEIKGLAKVINMENKATKTLKEVKDKFFTPEVSPKRSILFKTILDYNLDGKEPSKDKNEQFKRNINKIKELNDNPDQALETVNERTKGVYEVDPDIAANMVKSTTAAVSFLNSKIPKNPFEGKLLNKDYKYSEVEVAKFTKYLKAVHEPMTVIKDMADGYVSTEGIEALKVVYPTMFQELVNNFVEEVSKPEVQAKLSYDKKLALSLILDVPVDNMTEPNFLLSMQQNYNQEKTAQEDGNMGSQKLRKTNFTIADKTQTDVQRISNS